MATGLYAEVIAVNWLVESVIRKEFVIGVKKESCVKRPLVVSPGGFEWWSMIAAAFFIIWCATCGIGILETLATWEFHKKG